MIYWKSTSRDDLIWNDNEGYKVYQGSGKISGHIMTGCGGPLCLMRGTLREEELTDLPVFSGVEFTHSNPMTVLPIGVDAEIDCNEKTFTITESGVV